MAMAALRYRTLLGSSLILLLLLLAAVACGGDDDDVTGDDDDSPATSATVDGDDEPTEDAGDDDSEDTGDADDDDDGSDDDEGDNDGDGPDVCSLLTQDEIQEAIGSEVDDGEPTVNEPFYTCSWFSPEGFDFVTLGVLTGDDESLEFYFELSDDAEPVEGLGERAQFTSFGGLEVLTDNYDVEISVLAEALDDEGVRQAERELAEIVLDRLE
jgi:hypothetical protein